MKNKFSGKFSKIKKRAGWNKTVQVGIFHFLLVKIKVLARNFPKLINVQDGIRLCRLEFFKKLISCAARLLDRLEYVSLLDLDVSLLLGRPLRVAVFG